MYNSHKGDKAILFLRFSYVIFFDLVKQALQRLKIIWGGNFKRKFEFLDCDLNK